MDPDKPDAAAYRAAAGTVVRVAAPCPAAACAPAATAADADRQPAFAADAELADARNRFRGVAVPVCPAAPPATGRAAIGIAGRSGAFGRRTTRGAGVVGSGGVGVSGRRSSMRSLSVGGTTRPAVGAFAGVLAAGAGAAAKAGSAAAGSATAIGVSATAAGL